MTRKGSSFRALGAVAAGAWLAGTSVTARAQGPSDQCFSAPLDGQRLQKAGKLLDSRARFAACSRKKCPAKIVEACVRWSSEVDAAIPSVVLAARDARGNDLTDLRVSIDGNAALDLSPLAIELDPGPHSCVFQRAGAADVKEQAVLHEGEKNREVLARFRPTEASLPEAGASRAESAPTPQTTSRPAPPAAPAEAEPNDDAPSAPTPSDRPVPAAAWVLGGAGALAIVGFAAFAGIGLSTRANDHCDVGCPPSEYDTVTTDLRVADASLAVGILALGTAAVLYLARPAVRRSTGAWIDVRPTVGAGTVTFTNSF
jgi:hypothetical protein